MATTSPLENKLYARRFEDGLIDLFVAIGLIAIGASWMLDAPVYGAIAPAVLVPVWKKMRETMILPRQQSVTFKPERETKIRGPLTAWLIFGSAVLVTEIAIFLYASRDDGSFFDRLSEFVVALPAALIAIGLLGGLMIGARRFIGYGLGAMIIAVAGVTLNADRPGLLILTIGLMVLVCAGYLLNRFFVTHPLVDAEDAV